MSSNMKEQQTRSRSSTSSSRAITSTNWRTPTTPRETSPSPTKNSDIQQTIFKRFGKFMGSVNTSFRFLKTLEQNINTHDYSIQQAISACHYEDLIDQDGDITSEVQASVAEFLAALDVLIEQNVTDITYENKNQQICWTKDGTFDSKKIRQSLWNENRIPSQGWGASSRPSSPTRDSDSGYESGSSNTSNSTSRSTTSRKLTKIDLVRLSPEERAIRQGLEKSFTKLNKYGLGPESMPTTTFKPDSKGNQYYASTFTAPKPSTLPISSWHQTTPKKSENEIGMSIIDKFVAEGNQIWLQVLAIELIKKYKKVVWPKGERDISLGYLKSGLEDRNTHYDNNNSTSPTLHIRLYFTLSASKTRRLEFQKQHNDKTTSPKLHVRFLTRGTGRPGLNNNFSTNNKVRIADASNKVPRGTGRPEYPTPQQLLRPQQRQRLGTSYKVSY
ncbi:uncharacterized protein PAC_05535 [Phialocephala subalpina]|uniref:Uncharacterized protein n=1 Tax=Phialocephala subalpina TaxID=576137 RepID=A0A1L7WSB3_9HELO|nr:uncharacterized protein PAC_05535 [Phialocephala subalpina]